MAHWKRNRTQSAATVAKRLFRFARPLVAAMIILLPLSTFAEHFVWVVGHVDPNALTFLLFGYAILIYVIEQGGLVGQENL